MRLKNVQPLLCSDGAAQRCLRDATGKTLATGSREGLGGEHIVNEVV